MDDSADDSAGSEALNLRSLFRGLTAERVLFYVAIASLWVAAIISVTINDQIPGGWVAGWHRWDAEWYYQIWKDGWGFDPHTLVFMPVFPWLTGALADLTSLSFAAAAILINLPSYCVAGVIAAEFLDRRFKVPWWGVFVFHLCSPVAFFAFVPYSDALFCLLFWCAVVVVSEQSDFSFTRWRQHLPPGLLLMLLPLVRMTGFALVVWVFFRRWSAFAALLALAFFLYMNLKVTGEALFFLNTQLEFAMPTGWFGDGLLAVVDELLRPPLLPEQRVLWLQTSVLPLLSTLLILVTAGWLAGRRQWFFLGTLLAVAFFSRNQSYWRSVVRYDMPLVPMLALPWLTPPKGHRLKSFAVYFLTVVLLILGLVLQLGIGHRFHLGFWGF